MFFEPPRSIPLAQFRHFALRPTGLPHFGQKTLNDILPWALSAISSSPMLWSRDGCCVDWSEGLLMLEEGLRWMKNRVS